MITPNCTPGDGATAPFSALPTGADGMSFDELLDRWEDLGGQARRCGKEWSVRCLEHDDRHPSASIGEGEDDRVLIYCQVCSPGDEAGYFARTMARLRGDPVLTPERLERARARRTSRRDDTWRPSGVVHVYHSAEGRPVARKLRGERTDGETGETHRSFRWERAVTTASGGTAWLPRLADVAVPLYRLHKVRPRIDAGDAVLLCEGESDCEAAWERDYVATTSPHGASKNPGDSKWCDEYTEQLKGAARVDIVADADELGLAFAEIRRAALERAGIEVWAWKPPYAKDLREHLESGRTMEELEFVPAPVSATSTTTTPRQTEWSAPDLLAAHFDPPKYAVPGIVPQGLSMVIGGPKMGKSWLTLGIALGVASGGKVLGYIDVPQGEALVYALEDTPVRLQDRLRQMLGDEPAPQALTVVTALPRLGAGGADALDAALTKRPGCRYVVVDVLARVRDPLGKGQQYESDYAAIATLKEIADAHGVALTVVHHDRKAAASDFVEKCSGTNGIAGAADALLVLTRSRGRADARLNITGRDLEERTEALDFHAEPITGWRLSVEGQAAARELATTSATILSHLARTGVPLGPKQIADELSLSHPLVRRTLSRMVEREQVTKDGYGTYRSLAEGVTPVRVSQSTEPIQGKCDSGTTVTASTRTTVPSAPSTSDTPTDDLPPLWPDLDEPCEICGERTSVRYWPAPAFTMRCPEHPPPARFQSQPEHLTELPPLIKDEDAAERGYHCDTCAATTGLRYWPEPVGQLRCQAHSPQSEPEEAS